MADRYDFYRRLEPDPTQRSLARGFAAAIHDPVWFLARQWQMGEHQGENATTPVLIAYQAATTPLSPALDDISANPAAIPAEALVEREPDSWWTIGRRLRLGAALVRTHELDVAALDPSYRFMDPPPPYEQLAGGLDALAAWRSPLALGLTAESFAGFGIPPAHPFRWSSEEMVYSASFPVGETVLDLPRHRGGRIDWYSAAARGPLADDPGKPGHAYPTALHYPGSPNSRWWEIEDAAVDIGGYPPDSSHFATTLLLELVSTHGDDWFLFPVDGRAGTVLSLTSVIVTDAFGDTYELSAPADPWWLFRTSGLDPSSLVVWLRAMSPIEGPTVEDVMIGLDEYSNLLWAVERRLAGHAVNTEQTDPPPERAGLPSSPPGYAYSAGLGARAHWHPYEIVDGEDGRRQFVQRRLADLARPDPVLLPAATAQVLRVFDARGEAVHRIEPATIPSIGVVFERRYCLARDISGNPILWCQRQRKPFLRPPSRTMRFDVLAEDSPSV